MFSTTSKRSKLPANYEVKLGKRSGELALFWQRRENGPLATLAGLILLKRPVTVRHVEEAIAELQEYGTDGANRFAWQLWCRIVDRSDEKIPWYVTVLPDSVSRRRNAKKDYACAYIIERLTGLQCRNKGAFAVPGARGTFCALHAHQTVSRVARKQRRKT